MEGRLLQWLKDIGYRPQGRYCDVHFPTEEDLKLICRGEMKSCWAHLVRSVRSIEDAKMIRGNLKIQQRKAAVKQKKDDSKFKELRAQALSQKAHLRQLQEKLASLSNELKSLGRNIDSQEENISQLNENICGVKQRCELYTSFRNSIDEKIAALRRTNQLLCQPMMSRGRNGKEDSKSYEAKLENDCDSLTQKICQANIATMYQTRALEHSKSREMSMKLGALSPDTSNTNNPQENSNTRNAKSKSYFRLRVDIDDPLTFLESLSKITDRKTKMLEETIEAVDVNGEMENLKLKRMPTKLAKTVSEIETESLETVADPASALDALQMVVAERVKTHVSRFVETEEARSEYLKIYPDLDHSARQQQQDYHHHNQLKKPETLQEVQKENTSLQAQLRFLEERFQLLASERRGLLEKKAVAHKALKQVQEFSSSRKTRFDQIRQFVEATEQVENELVEVRRRVTDFCTQEILGNIDSLQHRRESLASMHKRELEMFGKVDINTDTNRALNWNSRQTALLAAAGCHVLRFEVLSQSMRSFLDSLDFHHSKSPGRVVEHIVERTEKLTRLKKLERLLLSQLDDMESAAQERSEEHANLMLRKAKRVPEFYDSRAKELQEYSNEMRHVVKQKLIAAKRNLEDWYGQPAQFQTPWKKVHGKNIEEWIAAMTAANARLQELLRN
mmetsp:Transcript_1343/g.2254  ORF Transcript_1343/g.2254 Transcript_1343/m.2254 type:complete len:677 (-) Transcript_1343:225-2255(-)